MISRFSPSEELIEDLLKKKGGVKVKIRVNEYIGDSVGKTDNEGYHSQIEIIFDKVPTAQRWIDFIKYIEAYDPDKEIEMGTVMTNNEFIDNLIVWLDEEKKTNFDIADDHRGPGGLGSHNADWREAKAMAFIEVKEHIEAMIGICDKPKEAQGNLYTRLKAMGINVIEENESKLNLEGSTTSLTDSTFGMRNGHKEANLFTFTKDGILSISNELTGAIKEALKEHILCDGCHKPIIKNITNDWIHEDTKEFCNLTNLYGIGYGLGLVFMNKDGELSISDEFAEAIAKALEDRPCKPIITIQKRSYRCWRKRLSKIFRTTGYCIRIKG